MKNVFIIKSRICFARLASFGVLTALFLVPFLFVLAMACFPSGYCGADGYSFSKHVVSDLGRTRMSNGAPNTLSCLLFCAAMTLTGFACALFWLVRCSFLRRAGLRHAVFVCGMGMSVSMLAIGWTPLNLVPKLHDPVTAVTAIAAALAILGLFTDSSDWLEKPRGKRIWLVILLSVSVVWSVLVALHHERRLAFRPWLPLWQKILIATFVAWMAHQMVLLFRVQEPDSTTGRK